MKLNIKWFSLTAVVVGTVPALVLFIWCSANGFGAELVRLFESIHPSGGFSIIGNMTGGFSAKVPGIIINTLYAVVDSFIGGFAFSVLYNFFVTRFAEEAGEK